MTPQKTNQAEPRGLSLTEFCARLGVSKNKVHLMISAGEVRSLKIGDRRIIPDSEVGRILALAEYADPAEPSDPPRGRGRPPRANLVTDKSVTPFIPEPAEPGS